MAHLELRPRQRHSFWELHENPKISRRKKFVPKCFNQVTCRTNQKTSRSVPSVPRPQLVKTSQTKNTRHCGGWFFFMTPRLVKRMNFDKFGVCGKFEVDLSWRIAHIDVGISLQFPVAGVNILHISAHCSLSFQWIFFLIYLLLNIKS